MIKIVSTTTTTGLLIGDRNFRTATALRDRNLPPPRQPATVIPRERYLFRLRRLRLAARGLITGRAILSIPRVVDPDSRSEAECILDSPGWKQITGGREESLSGLCRGRGPCGCQAELRGGNALRKNRSPAGACFYVSEYVSTLS